MQCGNAAGEIEQLLFQGVEGRFHQLSDAPGHGELFLIELVADQRNHPPAEKKMNAGSRYENQGGNDGNDPGAFLLPFNQRSVLHGDQRSNSCAMKKLTEAPGKKP